MPVRKLTVANAQIKTATVEVKTLTISGKQVTLAVFRQLQEEFILGDDLSPLEPLGPIWGRVNYHPDKLCAFAGEHVHIVWQKGDELRRCIVQNPIRIFTRLSESAPDEYYKFPLRWALTEWQEEAEQLLKDGRKEAHSKEAQSITAWRNTYVAFWESCLALDQLFIAV